jgi:hypothetical protein
LQRGLLRCCTTNTAMHRLKHVVYYVHCLQQHCLFGGRGVDIHTACLQDFSCCCVMCMLPFGVYVLVVLAANMRSKAGCGCLHAVCAT